MEIEANKQLIKRGLPKIRSELYRYDTSSKLPRYRPSIRFKGYFLTIGYGGKYENEADPNVAYYKPEGEKMKYYNLNK